MTGSTTAPAWVRGITLGLVLAGSTFVWAGPATATVDAINRGECSSSQASPVAQTQDPPGITDPDEDGSGGGPDSNNGPHRQPLVAIEDNNTDQDSDNAFQDKPQECPAPGR